MIETLRDFPLPQDRALKVCVTGGIGSGKSAFTKALVSLGGVPFDADDVTRRATAVGGSALPQILAAFGTTIFERSVQNIDEVNRPLHLDRKALAKIVFQDEAARKRLEEILHPLVWEEMDRLLQNFHFGEVMVAEVPLIAETGNHSKFDCLITVDSPVKTRLERLVQERGMEPEGARSRIEAQATDSQRREISHFWVENTGTVSELYEDAATVWEMFQSRIHAS